MALLDRYRSWMENLRKRRVWRLILNKYFIVAVAFLVWIIFLDNNNVIRWVRTRITLSEQKEQIEHYRREIQSTDDKINHMRSEKDSLESFARREYFYQEKGEDVFIVEE